MAVIGRSVSGSPADSASKKWLDRFPFAELEFTRMRKSQDEWITCTRWLGSLVRGSVHRRQR